MALLRKDRIHRIRLPLRPSMKKDLRMLIQIRSMVVSDVWAVARVSAAPTELALAVTRLSLLARSQGFSWTHQEPTNQSLSAWPIRSQHVF